MSNRYTLAQTDSPRTTYRVIDHSLDDEVALHPATLPSGAPHPLAGQPVSVVTSPAPAHYRVQGGGRPRTWGELGGYAVAVIERVPSWAAAPASAVLREDPAAFDGIPPTSCTPPPAACRSGPGARSRRRGTSSRPSAVPPPAPHSGHPPTPAASLAGPLRDRRRPRPLGTSRPGASPDGPVSLADGLAPPPRYSTQVPGRSSVYGAITRPNAPGDRRRPGTRPDRHPPPTPSPAPTGQAAGRPRRPPPSLRPCKPL